MGQVASETREDYVCEAKKVNKEKHKRLCDAGNKQAKRRTSDDNVGLRLLWSVKL